MYMYWYIHMSVYSRTGEPSQRGLEGSYPQESLGSGAVACRLARESPAKMPSWPAMASRHPTTEGKFYEDPIFEA